MWPWMVWYVPCRICKSSPDLLASSYLNNKPSIFKEGLSLQALLLQW
jgi:hypothetical protein